MPLFDKQGKPKMDQGIRAVWYDLPEQGRDEYFAWLHDVHLPRVVAFPGIMWAASYEIPGGSNNVPFHDKMQRPPAADDVPTGSQFIVLAGAAHPHIFFRPSAEQINETETADAKEMVGRRIGSRLGIYSEVLRVDGPEAGTRLPGTAPAPAIQMGSFRTGTLEEELDVGAWYTNYRMPAIAKMHGVVCGRRLASIAGWAKHAVMYEYTSLQARMEGFHAHEALGSDDGEWTNRVVTYTIHSPGSPSVAQRMWPKVD